jgi:DNA-binding NtrC family response regulator
MDVLVLDELKSRTTKLGEALEKRRYKVVHCETSNDFITSVSGTLPSLILADYDTWHHGRAIYSYFQIGKKIEHVPVVFYNAPQNFVALPDRSRHEKDYVLEKPSEVEAVVDAVAHSL